MYLPHHHYRTVGNWWGCLSGVAPDRAVHLCFGDPPSVHLLFYLFLVCFLSFIPLSPVWKRVVQWVREMFGKRGGKKNDLLD